MKIVVGSDHAGFPLKNDVAEHLLKLGHEVVDTGVFSPEPSDYPDAAEAVAKALLAGEGEKAVLICGSGVGVCVAANKIPGIRAGLCHDTYSAHQGVEHDDMNVLVMGSRIIGTALAEELVDTFLKAKFDLKEERFIRRFNKVLAIEKKYSKAGE